MTKQEAIRIIGIECECVNRNDSINCNRKCNDCDLVLPAEQIKEAYHVAIEALKG